MSATVCYFNLRNNSTWAWSNDIPLFEINHLVDYAQNKTTFCCLHQNLMSDSEKTDAKTYMNCQKKNLEHSTRVTLYHMVYDDSCNRPSALWKISTWYARLISYWMSLHWTDAQTVVHLQWSQNPKTGFLFMWNTWSHKKGFTHSRYYDNLSLLALELFYRTYFHHVHAKFVYQETNLLYLIMDNKTITTMMMIMIIIMKSGDFFLSGLDT